MAFRLAIDDPGQQAGSLGAGGARSVECRLGAAGSTRPVDWGVKYAIQ
jgi:hypothetical protein